MCSPVTTQHCNIEVRPFIFPYDPVFMENLVFTFFVRWVSSPEQEPCSRIAVNSRIEFSQCPKGLVRIPMILKPFAIPNAMQFYCSQIHMEMSSGCVLLCKDN